MATFPFGSHRRSAVSLDDNMLWCDHEAHRPACPTSACMSGIYLYLCLDFAVAFLQWSPIYPIRPSPDARIGQLRPDSYCLHNTGQAPFSLRLGAQCRRRNLSYNFIWPFAGQLPPACHRLCLDISDILKNYSSPHPATSE